MEPANSGNSEKLASQNHNHFIPNATTTTPLEPPSDVNANNNPFVESHISPLENNSAPTSLSTSSQNPFLLHNDATNTTHVMQQENGPIIHSSNDDMQSLHSSFTPLTYKSSQTNPFQVPINTTSNSQNVVENHDHVHDELHHHDPIKEDTNAHQKLGKDFHLAAESSEDDIPVSSMPNQGQHNNVSEIQNPPIQVMERSEHSANSSAQRIPLNIFTRNKSNTQWSTASNESLFSIQMGNMSFSNDMFWLNNKSGEFDHKPSDMALLPSQQPLTKFNDISQSTFAQQHECLRRTEEKAAETMREVIMETTSGNKSDKGNLTFGNGAKHSSRISSSNDHSHHSDGSTKSFAFKV